MAKKQVLPKHIINKFKKPQFKIGDVVFYAFLGDTGKGKVIDIKNEKTDQDIIYTVQGGKYKYPCGLKVSKYKSYSAGYILFEESRKHKKNIINPGGTDVEDANEHRNGDRCVDDSDRPISKQPRTGHSKKDGNIPGASQFIDSSTESRKGSGEFNKDELSKAIEKQKDFIRGFIKK